MLSSVSHWSPVHWVFPPVRRKRKSEGVITAEETLPINIYL